MCQIVAQDWKSLNPTERNLIFIVSDFSNEPFSVIAFNRYDAWEHFWLGKKGMQWKYKGI